ncbi:winged helix-turn-helix domain-containing protein [Aliikangiella sp. IMCC44359]|uniref:winged helix-turn-helix domain-containing protein n=1 Tax=Aliikangiella sp. IMCC44359 TaxID=3459125 RepID=UPI00403AA185
MNKSINYKLLDCLINCEEYYIEFANSTQVHLQPKILEVLNYLAKSYPKLVTREELIEQIWNNNFLVGEQALTNAIWSLRQTFRGVYGDKSLIETVRKAGYKLAEKPEFIKIEEKTNVSAILTQKNTRSIAVLLTSLVVLSITILINMLPSRTEFKKVVTKPITTEPGSEVFPALSPDEKYLVFKKQTHNHFTDLYLKNMHQPDLPLKQLTFDEAEEGIPVWSNDSNFIYYYKKEDSDKHCKIFQLNIKTLKEQGVFSCFIKGFPKLAISRKNNLLAYLTPVNEQDNAAIAIIDIIDNPINEQQPKIINCEKPCNYSVRDLAFSPDANKLAYTRRVDDYNENIYVVDLSTLRHQKITEQFYDILGLTWHTDNKRIIFGAQNSDIREGYVVDTENKELYSLDIPGFSFPYFSHKQKALLYHEKLEKYQIAALSLNKKIYSDLQSLIFSKFNHRNSDYSEAANKIAYISNESEHYELWISDLAGEKRKQLTYLEKEVSHPRWSHDGKKIAYLAPKESNIGNNIYVIDLASGRIEEIRSNFSVHGRPHWSQDNQSIYATVIDHEKTDLYQFLIKPERATELITEDVLYAQTNTPNNIFFTRKDKSLWLKNLNSNKPAKKILNSQDFGCAYLWELTDEGIFYYSKDKERFKINFYNIATKTIKPVAELTWLTDDQYGSFSFVKETNQLLITTAELPQSDIKLTYHPLLSNE